MTHRVGPENSQWVFMIFLGQARPSFRESCWFVSGVEYQVNHQEPLIPGSSRYVNFLPFGRFFWVKRHKCYTQKEDPGIFSIVFLEIQKFLPKISFKDMSMSVISGSPSTYGKPQPPQLDPARLLDPPRDRSGPATARDQLEGTSADLLKGKKGQGWGYLGGSNLLG